MREKDQKDKVELSSNPNSSLSLLNSMLNSNLYVQGEIKGGGNGRDNKEFVDNRVTSTIIATTGREKEMIL